MHLTILGQTVPPKPLKRLYLKVKEIEADYCKSDHMVDMMTEIFIIHVEDDVSDEIMMKAQAAGVSDDDEMTTNTNTASSSG
ncbi:hypothetical protein EVAR_55000_1 [Eumeta japonica]|uniref:Uncharacterized protein n=1 Tax=Eumeta variegata TaxID=151549 RepID=A0A4C1Z6M6_EUMVA|nr:hypothetical protein EVAR_55000_1 [Eumeta japonica]